MLHFKFYAGSENPMSVLSPEPFASNLGSMMLNESFQGRGSIVCTNAT